MASVTTAEEIDHVVRTYLRPETEWGRERIERVLSALGPRSGERILDLGAGNATFAHHCARAGARSAALDLNPAVLVRGRDAQASVGGPVPPRVAADASRAPFRGGTFDKVVSADFIEHITAAVWNRVAREAYRLLRSGGLYVVYTPNRWRVKMETGGERMKHLLGLRRDAPPPWHEVVDPDHAWMKSPREVERPLRSAGFRIRTTFFEHHLPFVSRILGSAPGRLPYVDRAAANRILVTAWKP